jgi:hypothetical protein
MPVNAFIQKYAPHVKGMLSGFDRLVFRGTLRVLSTVGGMMHYLWHMQVLLKEFGPFADAMTKRLKAASLQHAREAGRPIRYLQLSQISKEAEALRIAQEDHISEGLICVLTALEMCRSFAIRKDREQQKIVLVPAWRKGLQLYHYWFDPAFGLMHGRISSWFPFSIQICINGREWLARRMDQAGLAYQRRDNTFTWIEDIEEAQRMMDQLARLTWPHTLQTFADKLNPIHGEMFRSYPVQYYWSVYQSEWASDVMFDERREVEKIYPLLTRGAMEGFSAQEVMRFLGKKPSGNFLGEALSDYRTREEGVRVKHEVKRNSVKVYDKGSVLRVETTINQPGEYKTFRASERDPHGPRKSLRMAKGVADIERRAEVSQSCNDRYLTALSTLNTSEPLNKLVAPACVPTELNGHRVRALHPWSEPDQSLLTAVNDAAFCLNGFRNRDLLDRLYPNTPADPTQRRKLSARVTRQLRLLRAHHIILKVSHTNRYQVTAQGRRILTALLQYQHLSLDEIMKTAA